MYHAARAATFMSYGGDDHEQHTVLPSKLPKDFPDAAQHQNSLKNARFERNRADYDPYPRSDDDFSEAAATLVADATLIVSTTRKYLSTK
ncbi:hypothetical protein XarbCFBP8149_19440 [Xanthomonas arboricola]|nr:hypothetical protein XarbCFBP8149_19440 [Xanthomonas arboricola]